MAKSAAFWIEHLKLTPHPEGGFYRETYRSVGGIPAGALAPEFDGPRDFATAIYFLLSAGQVSAFHRIRSDEQWFWHAGGTLRLSAIGPGGRTEEWLLGDDPECGESPQVVVPAGRWFGAWPEPGAEFVLVSCVVAPGFDFRDFEMARREELLEEFPGCRGLIERLT